MNLLWLFFTVSSTLGTALSIFSLRIRVKKLRFLKQNNENGVLQFKAESEMLTEMFRMLGLGLLAFSGTNSYLYYSGPPLLPLPLAIFATFLPLLLSSSAIQQIWNEKAEHILIKEKIDTSSHRIAELMAKNKQLETIIESLEREVIELESQQTVQVEEVKQVSMIGIWSANAGLNVEEELKKISKHVAGWNLHVVMPNELTLEFLISDTLNRKFDVLHIGAHSDGEEIFLHNDELTVWGLAEYCSVLGIKLAVLLVCLGLEFAEMLLSKADIETVVYMAFEIGDDEAIQFANIFYMALSRGLSVEEAVKLCKMKLQNDTAYATIRTGGNKSLKASDL